MPTLVMHDASLHQIQRGWGVHFQAFFLAPYWWIRRKDAYNLIDRISKMGGLKKAYGIPRSTIYEAGSDRNFVRDPIAQLHEAMALKPDVIQVFDNPLKAKDSEKDVVEKLAINRRIIERSVQELKRMRMEERFMLLGVAHGDYPEAYLEEAKFINRHCHVVGIPVAAFTGKRKYQYVAEILTLIAKEVKKPIQCMPYDEKILTIQNGNYKIVKMGELVQKKPRNAFTLSLNTETLKTEIKPILSFFELGKREMVKITFEGKKEITLTDNSQVYTFREGKVRQTMVSQLKINDCVAVPIQIPSLDKEASFIVPPWIEGLYVAEGSPIGWLRNKKIENQGKQEAYDIKVGGNPNYLAIPSGIFVHNCMGYGLSNLESLRDVVQIAKRFDAYIWLEGSTIVRSSFAHRVLTQNPKSNKLNYVNTRTVKGAEEFNKVDCFTYNDKFFTSFLAELEKRV